MQSLHGVYKKATASAHSRTRSTQEESLAQPTMLLAFVCIQSLHLRIPPRVLHFSAIHIVLCICVCRAA